MPTREADRAGTGKPMSKDAFHEFLQKRIASCEAEITDISATLKVVEAREAAIRRVGEVDYTGILVLLMTLLSNLREKPWLQAQKEELEVKRKKQKSGFKTLLMPNHGNELV